MYQTCNDSRALMIAATHHRIAGDFLLAGSRGKDRLPLRAVICEQYTKSMRLALESFVTHRGVELEWHDARRNLFELFVYCKKLGLELRDTPDFSTENFEMLLVACGEQNYYESSSQNANYTTDLVWPQLYAAHLIEVITLIIEQNSNFIYNNNGTNSERRAAVPVRGVPSVPGRNFPIRQPGSAYVQDCFGRAAG